MGRPKGSKNKIQSGITYPRKCNHCNYISNNPAMWYYHDKIHQMIPSGTKCQLGCGNSAKFRNTKGTYSCSKISHHCPEYIRKHSERIKEHWQRPEAVDRKEETAKSIRKRLHNNENYEKMSNTKRKKFGTFTPDLAKNFRHYARFVRERAQKWAQESGYIIGQQTYHVDHKFSILDAWKNNLPERIVNHPVNLQILEAKTNSSKGSKSELTLEELYDNIRKYDEERYDT